MFPAESCSFLLWILTLLLACHLNYYYVQLQGGVRESGSHPLGVPRFPSSLYPYSVQYWVTGHEDSYIIRIRLFMFILFRSDKP